MIRSTKKTRFPQRFTGKEARAILVSINYHKGCPAEATAGKLLDALLSVTTPDAERTERELDGKNTGVHQVNYIILFDGGKAENV